LVSYAQVAYITKYAIEMLVPEYSSLSLACCGFGATISRISPWTEETRS
jgi:hypothetical protein